MTSYVSAKARADGRRLARIERRRLQLLEEMAQGDSDLWMELSMKTYAELICLRHIPPVLPGL